MLLLASLYALNYVVGSRTNEGIVLEWANKFALPLESTGSGPPTIYGKNFALVGVDTKKTDSEIVFRDSQSTFRCYASGRRYVNSMMTTLELCKRQDLLTRIINLVMQKKDKMIIEVSMNEANIQPMVFAVVKKKLSKNFISENKGVRKYARVITDPQAVLSSNKSKAQFLWPKKKLIILSESKDLFADMITEVAMNNVFDSETYLSCYDKYFESMHLTTEDKESQINLRFEYSLPGDATKIGEMEALIELVFHQIDVIGGHKLSAEALKKAQSKRKEVEEEEFKGTLAQRQEAAAMKRENKFQKEKQNMSAAQAAKAEEKRRNKVAKKMRPKMKMMK